MHATNDSLGVRSAYRFREQMRREGLMEYAGLPDRLSSFGRIVIVGPIPRKCPGVVVLAVDKVAWRGKRATESEGTDRPQHGPHEGRATIYFIGGSTISNPWRCRAFSSASASTSTVSVNTSGGLRILGGVQPTGRSTATSSRFAAA